MEEDEHTKLDLWPEDICTRTAIVYANIMSA